MLPRHRSLPLAQVLFVACGAATVLWKLRVLLDFDNKAAARRDHFDYYLAPGEPGVPEFWVILSLAIQNGLGVVGGIMILVIALKVGDRREGQWLALFLAFCYTPVKSILTDLGVPFSNEVGLALDDFLVLGIPLSLAMFATSFPVPLGDDAIATALQTAQQQRKEQFAMRMDRLQEWSYKEARVFWLPLFRGLDWGSRTILRRPLAAIVPRCSPLLTETFWDNRTDRLANKYRERVANDSSLPGRFSGAVLSEVVRYGVLLFLFVGAASVAVNAARISGTIPARGALNAVKLISATTIAGAIWTMFIGLHFQRALVVPKDVTRVRWLLAAVQLFLCLAIAYGVIGALSGGDLSLLFISVFYSLSVVLVTCCLLLGLFYDGALDPSLAIRKTTVYTIVGGVLVSTFVVIETLASDLIAQSLGFPERAGGWLAGSVVALGFGPLRNRVETLTNSWIDRLLPAHVLAEEGDRETAIVAFADLVGYTALTAESETKALTLVSIFHRTARSEAIAGGGRVVKTIGDGVLMEYGDALSALSACTRLQVALRDECETAALPLTQVRIGVHKGEVVRNRAGDIFGETVNVASRLESMAAPGRILASKEVVDELDPPLGLRLEPVGLLELRSIARPVFCYLCQ